MFLLMTSFDLLFLFLLLAGIITLIAAAVAALGGRRANALNLLRNLALCAVGYIGIVYLATALSRPVVLHIGEPQCSDDWCLTVERVERHSNSHNKTYNLTIRIFSRALRAAERELIAEDVYLVDSNWRRYDPIPEKANIPLNTLLQPGQSVLTDRRFQLPAEAHDIGLMIAHREPPICLIIGECGAFHKGTLVHLD